MGGCLEHGRGWQKKGDEEDNGRFPSNSQFEMGFN